jgi:hypothetical protein
MPRFSDLFIYETRALNDMMIMYNNCYLLTKVGELLPGVHVQKIIFDVDGMVLLLEHKGQLSGPHCLTIHN